MIKCRHNSKPEEAGVDGYTFQQSSMPRNKIKLFQSKEKQEDGLGFGVF